ncbi:hypothetical protein AX15_001178 [Amanita polypyramis BW_CC]|nr:hypothetical protein AX15_001178 [Amanita polypyramis BW_CC]
MSPPDLSPDPALDSLSHALTDVLLHDPPPSSDHADRPLPPPMIVYTRPQLLYLYNSPLVQPPSNMPGLKDWFGADLEQIAPRKDTESNTRERRYRRDADDGDASSRPSFRSAVSQPSQMGNFKHQSLRTGDRDNKDRDRDGDRDRDKEGQERLRHLSDKYDRDRMALPGSGLRGKERDGSSNSSLRLNSHSQTSALSSRRTENRDGPKKKSGEVIDDWRRSGEPSRSGREERPEGGRRDRDDRERPRSRARGSSRSRRDASSTRRERDERERRDDSARDRSSRGDRDLDKDKDTEYDDSRHWRDDGKRDERMAARRERENRERPSERDSAWDLSSDRRWPVDERDARNKRPTRDRKGEDVKDREERRDRERDRDREREKEKEPAWMDTYIPSGPNFGILGGKSSDGELDGIQAWKKGMKEKEQKEREKEQGLSSTTERGGSNIESTEKADVPEKQLDEIQLFKLLMKREKEKKTDLSPDITPASTDSTSLVLNMPNGSYTAAVTITDSTSSKDASPRERESHNMFQLTSSDIRDPLRETLVQPNTTSFDESTAPRKTSNSGYMPNTTQPEHTMVVEKTGNEIIAAYNPPSASRLLSLGRPPTSNKSPATGSSANAVHSVSLDSIYGQYGIKPESPHPPPGFSPFEEHNRALPEDTLVANAQEALRRLQKERPSPNMEGNHLDRNTYDLSNVGYPGPRGSRFAKFFDNKMRESTVPLPKPQTPVGLVHLGQRVEQNAHEPLHNAANEQRTLEDIFNMLSNSSQGHRGVANTPLALSNNHSISQQAQNNLQLLQQTAYQQQAQQIQNGHRMEPLYESRLDDRNFVPDGMVPGLRTVPPPRNRDTPLYSDGPEEPIYHNLQRPSQQRLDSMYSGPPPMFNAQRNVGIPVQQPHFRGGPSPISSQQGPLQNVQRLPPGLANLGGRPPHDPSHFLNMPGMPSSNLHTLNAPPQQQNFNAFTPNGGLSYNGPPLRGPIPVHQLQNSLNHTMNSLSPSNNLNPNQAQFLAMGGVGIGGLRNMNSGLTPQQGQSSQLHNPLLSMRQQQQPLHAHALPHMMPPHLSQQGMPGPTNQPAHDLMALLMGGPHRE